MLENFSRASFHFKTFLLKHGNTVISFPNMASARLNFVYLGVKIYCFFAVFFVWNSVLVLAESEVITEDNWDVVLEGHWMIKL